jgi:hypothetical protein
VEVVKNMPMYVGLDVHKRTCHATVIDESGEIVKEARFRNLRTEFEYFFKDIDNAKIAMEASYCYQPVYELLESIGYEVKLSHPKKTRAIAETKIKTDAKVPEVLARLLMLDWLPTSYVPPVEIRELRDLVRLLRWILTECVWVHLRHNTRLTRFFRRTAERRGTQVAAVAMARKLLVAIYWMLKRREEFKP